MPGCCGTPVPVHELLVDSVAGIDLKTPSYNGTKAVPLNRAAVEWHVAQPTNGPADLQDSRLNLHGLPPTTIVPAESDPLRPEGEMLAQRLAAAGGPVAQQRFPGATHEVFGMGRVVAEAKRAEDFAAMRLKAPVVAPAGPPPGGPPHGWLRARRAILAHSNGYIRYGDHVETVAEDEAAVIDGIIATMTRESQTVAERDGQTVRASHAKSTGLTKGTLAVLPNLSEPLRQGLFATPRSYPVLMRFAQGPGEKLSDSVSTHRGVALKVLGVEGPKLPGHDGATQDFVFATGPAFPQSNASTFLTAIKGIQKGTGLPEAVKQAVSSTARVANAALNAVGRDSATFGFFGHTKRNPLADAYFSQAALRYGDYVAKMGLFPVSPELVAMVDQTLDTGADPEAFRHAVVDHLRAHGAEFEVRVQLCTDLDAMPVEDASVPWPEDQSPYIAVARLAVPAQDAYSPARQAYFDEVLSFQPSHALAAHRPLGSLMRARLNTYRALSAYRHAQNRQPQVEPTRADQVPD